MLIGEICDRRVPIAPGTTTVAAAAKAMHAFDEHVLVVTEERDGKQRAVGTVTDRELGAVLAQDADPRRLTLQDIMRLPAAFVAESDSGLDTLCWMRRYGLRDAVVHDESGAVLGIVSLDQLVESLANEIGETAPPGAEGGLRQRRETLH
jgi:CBS domain containing-hemolysin-like protein